MLINYRLKAGVVRVAPGPIAGMVDWTARSSGASASVGLTQFRTTATVFRVDPRKTTAAGR